jgi:hypothetical protein
VPRVARRLAAALVAGAALATAPAAAAPGTLTTPSAPGQVGASPGVPAGTLPPTATQQPSTPLTLAPRAAAPARPAHKSSGISHGAIVLAVLAALLALGSAAWALARMAAYEPRWTVGLRHSMAEAGYRASATWSELADWIRLGR